ncbi:class E sortase [Streptomyces sp. NPDC048664]|uniref:class E sortase n=1 Tax=Streptomyces sp. NPDC048664 TaxID=3154505 RepID=UPI00341F1FD8
MTALRPERESGAAQRGAAEPGPPYGQQPYGDAGAWQRGQQGQDWSGQMPRPRQAGRPSYDTPAAVPYDHGQYDHVPYDDGRYDDGQGHGYGYGDPDAYAGRGAHDGHESAPYGGAAHNGPAYGGPAHDHTTYDTSFRDAAFHGVPAPADSETVALRVADTEEARGAGHRAGGAASAPGGRAERRRAARKHGGRRGSGPGTAENAAGRAQEAPRSRVEARRAARARKPSTGVLMSRVIGELFITAGVVMLLFVTYQLWWSNVRAHAEAGSAARHLQQDWADGKRAPGAFAPGQGFAILHIPKLDVVAPIAEGTSKTQVLDKGMVGHYGEGGLKTAMPDAKAGNFGLAAHRNTHGEPFRYINLLKPGDPIVVETQDEYYVYKMTSTLPVTSPANTSVLDPIPQGSGFTEPGRYITLTTCTPEFTSTYRLIVWGKMVEERPRSKGKPDALL